MGYYMEYFDFFEKNLSSLKRNHLDVYNTIISENCSPLGTICKSENGAINLSVQSTSGTEYLMHDSINPINDIDQYTDLVPDNASGIVFFIGMGLGYGPLEILKKRKQIRYLIVFELNCGIFLQALHAIDLTDMFEDIRFRIILNENPAVMSTIEPYGRVLQLECVQVLNHRQSFQLDFTNYDLLRQEVINCASTFNIGGATTMTYGKKLLENRIRNLTSVHHNYLLEDLKNIFKSIPAFIISGGPSLDKNIQYLKNAKNKGVIIAADAVLPALIAHNITPDFVTAIDMVDYVSEKIASCIDSASNISLVLTAFANPRVSKNFPAQNIFWTYMGSHVETWINNLLGGTISTGGAGSVAHLSFTTAKLLGCSPIIFVGQDLAYTNQQDHSTYATLRTQNHADNLLKNNQLQLIEGYGGTKVFTDGEFFEYKNHFERLIAGDTTCRYINSTEGGARIKGTDEILLKDVLDDICIENYDIIGKLKHVTCNARKLPNRSKMIKSLAQILKSMYSNIKMIQKMDSLCNSVLNTLNEYIVANDSIDSFSKLPQSLQRIFSEIDLINQQLDLSNVWKLLDEITIQGLKASDRLRHKIDQMAGKPELYLNWLQANIQRFQLINKCRVDSINDFQHIFAEVQDRLKSENNLLAKIENTPSKTNIINLFELYFNSKDYSLLNSAIAKYITMVKDDKLFDFYRGVIALRFEKFDQANNFFENILKNSPSILDKITFVRFNIADEYLSFYNDLIIYDRITSLKMLFKGIKFYQSHDGINCRLIHRFDELIMSLSHHKPDNDLSATLNESKVWCHEISVNDSLVQVLGEEKCASLSLEYARLLFTTQKLDEARLAVEQAIRLNPSSHEMFVLLVNVCFSLGDFNAGIAALENAVKLDRNCAMIWEDIGDNLAGAGQPGDAVMAYEKCFLSLPEHSAVLKKIGDCYRGMGNIPGAEEAYRIYHERNS